MNKLSIILSFLISFICFTSQSWALPNCSSSPPFDNCYGSYTFANGNTYVGEWQNNKYDGQGIFIFKSGEKYVGEFKNGKRHGQGTNTFKSGAKFEGEFKNGKRHGQGIYTFASGAKYEGEYKNGKRHGQGTNTFANGDKYVGEYKDDKKNGIGTYTYGLNTKWAGYKYSGEYKNGKRHGQGTFNYANGTKDIGEFKNDYLDGFAVRYDKYGNILKQGIWKDDKFLYSQNKSISSNSNSKLDKYKSFCSEIGFTPGTEKFGDCVLEAMKKG